LLPHWNWSGKEGSEIDVRALSNCEEVELFLNGRSLGRQTLKRTETLKWKVPYAPGTLSAKGFKGGQLAAETKVETTGAPAAVLLTPDRATIDANSEDVSVITVAVTDAAGRVVPAAGNAVKFELEGPGRIIGVGNGDPSCHEPDKFVATAPLRTVTIGGWRWKKIANIYTQDLPETGVSMDDSSWDKLDVMAESGPLGSREQGVFRTRFIVSAQDLTAPAMELCFGKIEGDGKVFVNGQLVGPAGDPRAASSYDVKTLLHPGENMIAVTVANYGSSAGLNKGVCLRVPEAPPPVEWGRSVFNGLAQIIVQSSKEAGAIKLTARSAGLQPATILLQAKTAAPRPAVP
jgi:beta-galactosidase